MLVFLRCVGEALVAQGMRGLLGLAPFGEQIYDVAANAIERYRQARREQQVAADLQEVVQADMQQIRAQAKQIAQEVGAGRSENEIRQIEAYLTQIPGVARQSLRRPQDPSGTTVPASLNLADPIQLAGLLPRRAPRFRIDDAMPHAPQWRFVELLGSGGFGEVWLVRHTFLDQCRAVKFCLDPVGRERLLRHEWEIVKRVMTESKLIKANEHGIVPLVDAYPEGDSPWLAYEYVAGGDLAGVIRHLQQADAPQRAKQALDVLRVLANIVGRFHRLAQPIIHRDLKPANILLTKDRLLRITDFGISHIAAEQEIRQATISTPSLSLGATYRGAHTPIYASPQQKKGLKADVRDDVHALGIIGYQMLLADLGAERPAGKWRKRVADCGLPDAMLDLLESCWDDDPEERPRDALALAEALAPAPPPPPPPPAKTKDLSEQTEKKERKQESKYQDADQSLDDLKRGFVEEVKLLAFDNGYIDCEEEREILTWALQRGISVDSARVSLVQVCDANGYVLESTVMRDVREMIRAAADPGDNITQKDFNNAVALCERGLRGKKTDLGVKKIVVEIIEKYSFKPKQGFPNRWYDSVKREAGF